MWPPLRTAREKPAIVSQLVPDDTCAPRVVGEAVNTCEVKCSTNNNNQAAISPALPQSFPASQRDRDGGADGGRYMCAFGAGMSTKNKTQTIVLYPT
jgi:hypothetical protein